MSRLTALLVAAFVITVPLRAADPPLAGRFCVIEAKTSQCRDTTGPTVLLQENDVVGKLFVWTRSDEQLVIAGAIPKTPSIELKALSTATVGLPLALKAAKDITVRPPVAFTLTSREKNWRWEMTAAVVNRKDPVLLRLLPAAEYSLTIAANRLLPLTSGRFEIRSSTHDLPAREFHFRDLPILSGTVRSASTRTPLPDVRIMSDGVLLATTGPNGRFQYTAMKSGNATLEFSRNGYATHFAPIVVPPESTELAPVFLDKGATIRVEVKSDGPLERAVSADLMRVSPVNYVKERSTPVSRFATFEHVESGDYIIVLNGSGPLEHLAMKTSVDAGASLVEGVATIKPLVVSGSIHMGDSPLSDAQMTVSDSSYSVWSGLVRPQPDGTFSETVWDRGFRGSITSTQLEQPYTTFKTIQSNFDASWDIVIPTGRITGRVHDKETGQPIPGALLRYAVTGAGGRILVRDRRVNVHEDGTFTISAAANGSYILDCNAVGYGASEPLRVTIADSSPTAAVDIPLAKGDSITLHVSHSDGEPVPNASILIVDANNYLSLGLVTPPLRTDGLGEVHMTRPRSGTRLFALSPAGPWTEFTVPDDADPDNPVRVLLPRCDVRLHIRAIDVGGRPISGATFFVRYNGAVIPVQVWSYMSNLRMVPAETGPSGDTTFAQMPAGTYELVPFVYPSELRRASAQKKWPVEASLAGGDAELTLVFEKAD